MAPTMNTSAAEQSREIDWYFDFISPFVYLQHCRLTRDYPEIRINFYPVIFGALLQKYDHKGPAEIESKRLMTLRYCHWYAKKQGFDFRFPDTHPFRPVSTLRLALAANCEPAAIRRIFEFIWAAGHDPSEENNYPELAGQHGIDDAKAATQHPDVKSRLMENTRRAIDLGAFGVPTIVIGDKLFWGEDVTGMAMDFLDNPALFDAQEYQRLESIPNGLA